MEPRIKYDVIIQGFARSILTGIFLLGFFVPYPLVSFGFDKVAPGNTETDEQPSLPNINSLLVDKELPILGGKWHGQIFVDAPLNGEPEGAKITLRRAKLIYSRGFGNNWQLKLSANYHQGNGFELSDSYFVYSGWQRMRLTLGVIDPPFSLESVSSFSSLTFMERGLVVASLSEKKGAGVTFLKRTGKSILNGMLVLANVSQDHLREKGQAIVLHYVHSPIKIRDRNNDIHIGGSLSYRLKATEDYSQFRSRPEVATMDNYFVDTGQIDSAKNVLRASLEASRVAGRFSWQTELIGSQVRRNGAESVTFWGAYAYISWFLSNDSRNYDAGVGKFLPLVPNTSVFGGGRGAFELAFRASYVDLTDKDVIGGRESNLSLGFNWYLNRKLRLMANVIKVLDVKRPDSEYDGQDPLIFAVRAQWLIQ